MLELRHPPCGDWAPTILRSETILRGDLYAQATGQLGRPSRGLALVRFGHRYSAAPTVPQLARVGAICSGTQNSSGLKRACLA
jgi:hypothetical protein